MSETPITTRKTPFLERKNMEEETAEKIKKKIMRENLKPFYDFCNKEENFKDNILGKRIMVIRKENGLSQEELAKKSGINRSTIIYVENGKGKELSYYGTIEKIVSALNCDIKTFISFPENQKKWQRLFYHTRILNSEEDGLEEIPVIVELNHLKQRIFQLLETDYVSYKKNTNDEDILVPPKYLELLRMEIYKSFQTIDFLLNNK